MAPGATSRHSVRPSTFHSLAPGQGHTAGRSRGPCRRFVRAPALKATGRRAKVPSLIWGPESGSGGATVGRECVSVGPCKGQARTSLEGLSGGGGGDSLRQLSHLKVFLSIPCMRINSIQSPRASKHYVQLFRKLFRENLNTMAWKQHIATYVATPTPS